MIIANPEVSNNVGLEPSCNITEAQSPEVSIAANSAQDASAVRQQNIAGQRSYLLSNSRGPLFISMFTVYISDDENENDTEARDESLVNENIDTEARDESLVNENIENVSSSMPDVVAQSSPNEDEEQMGPTQEDFHLEESSINAGLLPDEVRPTHAVESDCNEISSTTE